MGRQLTLYLLALSFALSATSKVPEQDPAFTIDFPGATSTNALGINPRGDIVGFYTLSGTTHGFLLSRGQLTSIDFPGATLTNAMGIDPRGDIVGAYTSAGVTHGYLFSAGQFSTIDFPGATETLARGIDPSGDIVGVYTLSGTRRANGAAPGNLPRKKTSPIAPIFQSDGAGVIRNH